MSSSGEEGGVPAPLHLGTLKGQPAAPGDALVPIVEADVLSLLVPCELKHRGSTRLQFEKMDRLDSKVRPLPLRSKRKLPSRAYYVCTLQGCNWSGSGRKRHSNKRPDCTAVPCLFERRGDDSTKQEVGRFLARCTPTQREHGLPPDGGIPVPRRGSDGEPDPSVLYMTVPAGASPGSDIRVMVSIGAWDTVHVPDNLAPGDIMQINVAASENKRKRQGENERRKQRRLAERQTATDAGTGARHDDDDQFGPHDVDELDDDDDDGEDDGEEPS